MDILPSDVLHEHTQTCKQILTRLSTVCVLRTYTTYKHDWSALIHARTAPFVLKLEVTKRILTSLASSFYSLAFRHNVQRGFQWQRRGEGTKKETEGEGREKGMRDDKKKRMKTNASYGANYKECSASLWE